MVLKSELMNSEGKMAEDRHQCDRRWQNYKYGGESYGRVWSQQIKTMSLLNKACPWPTVPPYSIELLLLSTLLGEEDLQSHGCL